MSKTKEKKYWLIKSEPEVFSFSDLLAAPKQTTFWEGVRNYQARNFLRDEFKIGDLVLFYHSNTVEPGIVGTAEVVKEGYPDHAAFDSKSEYYDDAAKRKGVNPWVMVDVRAVVAFASNVSRARLSAEPKLKKMMVLKKGARLSIQPVTPDEFAVIIKLGAKK